LSFTDKDEYKNLLSEKKLFVFDQDGTIYLGDRIFPEAVKFIEDLRSSGRRVLFFTNNASHDKGFYLSKLTRAGFSPKESEILTAGDVTAEYVLKNHSDEGVYLVGTRELWEDYSRRGVNLVCDGEGHLISDEKISVVITSFDTELTYEKLRIACQSIMNGAEYLCTHPDYNCPVEGGFIPDSGAIAAAVTASTGVTPKVFGKPSAMTADMISKITGEAKENICIVGDRLYTDIATGKKNGITAMLVLTGESTFDEAAALSEADRPDIIVNDLAEAGKILFG